MNDYELGTALLDVDIDIDIDDDVNLPLIMVLFWACIQPAVAIVATTMEMGMKI